MGEAGPHEEDRPVLKSKKSVHYSFIRFLNSTKRRVDVIWVNYEGAGVKYRTLSPNHFLDINTFAGHPWIFFDSDTGDRMVVQTKEIFEPVAWSAENGNWPPQRKIINITIPVYSLQECCLLNLRHLIPRNKLDELDIPETLKQDLHKVMCGRGSNITLPSSSAGSSSVT